MGQPEAEGGKRDPLLGILWDLRVAESFAFCLNGRKLFAHLIFFFSTLSKMRQPIAKVLFTLIFLFLGLFKFISRPCF